MMSDLKDKSWWLSNLYHPCEHLFPLVEEESIPPKNCPTCAEIKGREEPAHRKQFEEDCKAVCGFCLEGLRVDYSISKEYWHHGPYDNSPDIGIRLCAADRLRRAWEERTP